jgi:NitT/TauT family transport system permease protein
MMELMPRVSFPSVQQIGGAIVEGFSTGALPRAAGFSVAIILEGLAFGIVIAFVLCVLSISFRPIYTIFNTLIATFDTLPGIALMPLMLIWFPSFNVVIIVLMIHGVLWPMGRSVLDGYNATPKIYQEIGQNIGLSRLGLIKGVYLPSSLPFIISGVKTGWARAWRALISAEMIFGTIGGGLQGIGWMIHEERIRMNIPGLIAAILAILAIGLIMEYGIFAQVEKRTIRKWGMVR